MQFDPSSKALPKRSELTPIEGAPDGAAWFWGKDDEVFLYVDACKQNLTGNSSGV
jgi:hypothetical protein